jgi:hypothetical protein
MIRTPAHSQTLTSGINFSFILIIKKYFNFPHCLGLRQRVDEDWEFNKLSFIDGR